MRIAWATPFNNQSAVGRHALDVVSELRRRGVPVDILRTEIGAAADMTPWSNEIPVRRLSDMDLGALRNEFDLFVVALGDQFDFKFGTFDLLRAGPAVGIVYEPEGQAGKGPADPTLDGEKAVALENVGPVAARDAPFGDELNWISTLCAGAVLHSKHYLPVLEAYCPGPALVLPLCVTDPGRPRAIRSEGEFVIVTIGHVDQDRQIDRVMRAIGQSAALRSRATHRVAGAISADERDRLTSLAGELDIRPPEFLGWLADDRLQEALGQANAVSCLRFPVSKNRSLSLISSLYSGTPLIIPDAGPYGEVPEELVWKVSDGNEFGDVARALEAIAADQQGADHRGAAAREWARRTYSVEAYVDRLLPLLQECLDASCVMEAGRQFGAILYDMGASLDDPAAKRVGAVLDDLFGTKREGQAR